MNMRLNSLQSALLLAVFLTGSVTAQDKSKQKTTPSKSDDSLQIIITKDKSKNEKMTIVIDGDKITVNGKPAAEFKEGNLTIHSGSGEDNWWGVEIDPEQLQSDIMYLWLGGYEVKFFYVPLVSIAEYRIINF